VIQKPDSTLNASTLPDDKRLIVIQRNPRSGSGAGRKELLNLVRALRAAQYRVRMFRSREKLDAWLSTPGRQQVLRCIVAAGGDGTVADVVNRHVGCPVAILPLGTENLLAKHLNLPRCGRTLSKVIDIGRFRKFDSAATNGRRFLLMLSVGVDGEIVHAIHRSRTGTIRRIRYVIPTLRAFLAWSPKQIRVSDMEGNSIVSGTHVIVTNIPRYGFGLSFAPEAFPDDGLLNVRVYHGISRWQIFWHAVRLKLRLPIRSVEVTKFTAKRLMLDSPDNLQIDGVQVDGDPCSSLPVEVEVQPASLCLLVF